MPITTIKIFPPIGIARIGNSPSDFFIGPELPGLRTPPPGGYKDASCRVKRQGARFRLFGYDETNTLVGEITAADASITWTAHLANTKPSWRLFAGLSTSPTFRNSGVMDRSTLEIDPGPRSLDGPNQAAGFNTGRFLGSLVPLGEMRTDSDGRLLILGGFGRSGSVPEGVAITHYANNDNWHDDVSDGPVTASVLLNGALTPITAVPAWVICPPPDFAPPLDSITTLYDLLFQVAVDKGMLTIPATPSFGSDIYPILHRVFQLQRVNTLVSSGHGDFDAAAAMTPARRAAIFARLRNPNSPMSGGPATMPLLWDDNNQGFQTVTKAQYEILKKWKDGTFVNDAPPPPAASITPDGLTRAALEACVGGALYPGIEASWFMRDTYNYIEPFRLDHTGRKAGDVTKQMAVPWQADFLKCYTYGGLAWWPAQRPDDVFPEGGGGAVPWIREIVSTHEDMVKNWHKLGFIVKKGSDYVETERRKVCTNIFLVIDRSHFSEDEVDGVLSGGTPAKFDDAIYVIAEGFLPSELGITMANPTEAQIAGIAPSITIKRQDSTNVPDMIAVPAKLLLQDASLPATLRQRFTFVYQIEFATVNGFYIGGMPEESQMVNVTATKGTYTSSGQLTLFHQPNPYMLDGATSWLSTDVRVFKITEGDSRFGATIGNDAAGALSFINSVITAFNAHAPAGHPYDTITTDQAASQLELSEKVGTKRVFNFAVARVRYRGKVLDATDVRVFFRLFTTAATGMDYNMNSTYRRSGSGGISLLGLQAGKLVTIPFYGTARVNSAAADLSTQTDPLNVRTLVHAGANEVHGYFGCWLDINQTATQFPSDPSPVDGPWGVGRKSIQQHIRGMHQCLVAEVFFPSDPIPAGASPASNDNLAQRNLAIVESDNPGSLATHTVQHTFEIKATNPAGEVRVAVEGDGEFALTRTRVLAAGPDELMIRWGTLPRATVMTIYMPDVDADEIMQIAGQSYEAVGLEKVDGHTVRCFPGDVTYLPLPSGRSRNTAALITMELPEGVKRGQKFNLVIHQISGRPRKILGAFQIDIPVSDKDVLLEPEIRKLSVLRHIHLAIPQEDQWHPVFTRYLNQIAARVKGFGGDPDRVAPSPDGSGRGEGPALLGDDTTTEGISGRCRMYGWVLALLIALLIVIAGLHLQPNYLPEILVGLAIVIAAAMWRASCRPSACRAVIAVTIGLAIGAAVLAVLILAGIAGTTAGMVIWVALIDLVIALAIGLGMGCFGPRRRTGA